MPQHQQSPRKQSKAQIWAKRTVHLKTYLQDLPRRLRLDVEALVKIFLTRRSLLLKLADNYLVKLWECSRATVQRRLERLEQLGLLKRMTQPPRKQPNGTWKQERKLVQDYVDTVIGPTATSLYGHDHRHPLMTDDAYAKLLDQAAFKNGPS